MNRLQQKCVIATAGIHLLLLLVLVFGSAFFSPRPKPDDTQLLDVIPANLIDAAFNSGVKNATPPAPAPVTVPPPQPVPPAPVIQPTPPPPAPKPVEPPPTLLERAEKFFKPEPKPEPAKPAPEKAETQPHKIQVNTQRVSRVPPKNTATDNSRKNTAAINTALKNLQKNLSRGTVVDTPGTSTVAFGSYRDALATIYYNAWVTPDNAVNDEADAIARITVASDGTVVTSRIVTPSGDAKVDDSVRRALDRVSSVPPLPDKSKSEQEFTIDFNLKTKRMLE
jgi:TonB family protein